MGMSPLVISATYAQACELFTGYFGIFDVTFRSDNSGNETGSAHGFEHLNRTSYSTSKTHTNIQRVHVLIRLIGIWDAGCTQSFSRANQCLEGRAIHWSNDNFRITSGQLRFEFLGFRLRDYNWFEITKQFNFLIEDFLVRIVAMEEFRFCRVFVIKRGSRKSSGSSPIK